ncbi:MAG: adventurous gliding motility protein CglF [Myxococcales bacterium]|nr:adventurous gliding motility protein CglF [Myxococcales bacterium]
MSDVSAEEADAEENVIYRQRTVYSFDGDTIDGDLLRPDGAYIEARKEVQHSNLIKVREDFRDKVLESVIHLW